MCSPKISVILPVFNPGSGIKKCLNSLRNQTLKDVEYLFIDDCGTDQSMSIIEKIATEDKRIRIIRNQHNIGAGNSRNVGIENARGEYLSFIDPDDYIAEDFLELLYNKTNRKPDIVKGLKHRIDIHGNLIIEKDQSNKIIEEGLEQHKPLFTLFRGAHVTAIYRRDFILSSGARYGKTSNNEDTTFLLMVTFYAKSIELENNAYYYYVAREGSRVRDYTEKRIWDDLYGFKEKIDFLDHRISDPKNIYEYVYINLVYLLKLGLKISTIESLCKTSAIFLNEIKVFISSLPYVDGLVNYDLLIKGLIIYDANLSTSPFEIMMNKPRYFEYKKVVENWVGFLCSNPSLLSESQKRIQFVFTNALTFKDWNQEGLDKIKEHKYLREMALTLPDVSVLSQDYMTMKLFVKYGIDLFWLRDSTFGILGKKVLSFARKIRKNKK